MVPDSRKDGMTHASRNDTEEQQMVLRALRTTGLDISTLDELVNTAQPYPDAVPILLRFLPIVRHSNAKEAIVRALAVKEARGVAAIPLIREFLNIPGEDMGLKWAIGNTLFVVADDSVFQELAELARDRSHGRSRERIVEALGNVKTPQAIDVLLEVLHDEDVNGQAIIALGKLRARRAIREIESFSDHPSPWLRRVARQASRRIKRAIAGAR